MWSGRPPRRPPLSGAPVGSSHQFQQCLNVEDSFVRQMHFVQNGSTRRQGARFITSCLSGPDNDATTSMPGSRITSDEVYIKSWLNLPNSQYCIQYELGSARTSRNDILSSSSSSSSLDQCKGITILQLVASKSPFELKMQELKSVLQQKYPQGAGLVYVREFLEPADPDFPLARTTGVAGGGCSSSGAALVNNENNSNGQCPTLVVHVSTLSREQVGRLRLLIVGDKRRDVLVSTLRFYSTLPYHSQASVVDHFESFKAAYAKTRDHRKKVDSLLAVTMALHKYRGWMYRLDRGLGRSKMVESLATRWKNLLSTKTPMEMGLDEEFSFPAVMALLQDFKRTVESAPTYGDPKMVFKFDPGPPQQGE
jgi:hypothetical protein